MSDYLEKTFQFRGKEIWLQIYSGIVIETDTRSDTYVSGSGKSSHFGGYGGGSTQISSTVVVTKELWIRTVSGKEYSFQIDDLAVRAGHIVDFGVVNGNNAILKNRTTDTTWYLGKAIKHFLNKKRGVLHTLFWALVGGASFFSSIWLVLGIAVLFIDHHEVLGTVICLSIVAAFTMYVIAVISRASQAKEALEREFLSLNPQMQEIANQLQSKPPTAITQSESAFCSGCGKPAVPDVVFCGGCGTKLIAA